MVSTNMTGQNSLSAFASMALEQDLLLELKHSANLYNRVTELFFAAAKSAKLEKGRPC